MDQLKLLILIIAIVCTSCCKAPKCKCELLDQDDKTWIPYLENQTFTFVSDSSDTITLNIGDVWTQELEGKVSKGYGGGTRCHEMKFYNLTLNTDSVNFEFHIAITNVYDTLQLHIQGNHQTEEEVMYYRYFKFREETYAESHVSPFFIDIGEGIAKIVGSVSYQNCYSHPLDNFKTILTSSENDGIIQIYTDSIMYNLQQ